MWVCVRAADAGAVIDAKDMNGGTPLTGASWYGHRATRTRMSGLGEAIGRGCQKFHDIPRKTPTDSVSCTSRSREFVRIRV